MLFESRVRHRIRKRVEAILLEVDKPMPPEEILREFQRRGYPRVLKKVVETILQERVAGVVYYKP